MTFILACEHHRKEAAEFGSIGERLVALATEAIDDYDECSEPPCRKLSEIKM